MDKLMRFSDRYGYTNPNTVLKREVLDDVAAKVLCTCFDLLNEWLDDWDYTSRIPYQGTVSYSILEERVWCYFLNNRKNDFKTYNGHVVVITKYLLEPEAKWYDKLNLIEFSIRFLKKWNSKDILFQTIVDNFKKSLNQAFERLNLAYRLVNEDIIEITSAEEITSIEDALKVSSSSNGHLSEALKLLAQKPNPDYRNSIKESISSVEAECRYLTGETTLGKALKKLEDRGVSIPDSLRTAFEKLYVYTNDEKTGIRHALMNDSYAPGYDEAKFMLVACSAFVNYLRSK